MPREVSLFRHVLVLALGITKVEWVCFSRPDRTYVLVAHN